ncbi:MAG: hypothetical protein LBQ61_06475 [Spirochaetales bacterium]|nr:hypothetical protein [Spirochaetales bacterium]
MKKPRIKREYLIIGSIIGLFLLVILLALLSIGRLQGTARVINYVGIVRGAAQMLVKEELMGRTDDTLITEIDSIVNELVSGRGPLKLVLLPDPPYRENMNLVKRYWDRIKFEINQLRADAFRYQYRLLDQNNLVAETLFNSSQTFFEQTNRTVFAAEAFSDRQLNRSLITLSGASLFSVLMVVAGLIYLIKLKTAAESAHLEITAMKDNLRIGLFFMDKDFLIQPHYSKAMESLFDEEELRGKNFLDLLQSSVSAKELETLKDYFTMIVTRSHDAALLEEINPIHELTFVHSKTRQEKNLRCDFVLVDRGGGGLFILSLIEDITKEKKLADQLSQEEAVRQEDMRSLFEVIQVEPRIFGDFLEDTEYEFTRINEMLKNKELTAQYFMIDIYQSIHAIKSNAVILGLSNFSGKLQKLETEIKQFQNQENITFENVLHITIMIQSIMEEKDKLRETLDKIRSFRISEIKNQDEYVFVQSLLKTCEKVARDLNKKAELVVDAIDPRALEAGPRRAMKEILIQLIRNAVYHGIETPEERQGAGKNEAGTVHLSITVEDERIHIKLTDDGQGIDFNQVREKAKTLKFFKDLKGIQDKKQLVQVIFAPGFSTAEDAGMHAGRGIGLSLVRNRLHDVGGVLRLQSETGKGTVFNISIPLSVSEAHKAS